MFQYKNGKDQEITSSVKLGHDIHVLVPKTWEISAEEIN